MIIKYNLRLDIGIELQYLGEIMNLDKLLKYMDFMMNVHVSMVIVMFGNILQNFLIIYH